MEVTLNLKTSANPEDRIIQVELNEPQMMVQMISANETFLLWGRGTGKSTGGLAPFMARVADAMPGHLSCLLGLHYTHLETNVIPKLLLGLQTIGYKKDKHYVTGRPPKSWPNCLYPIENFDRTITWRNGTSFQQISIEQKGSANAFDFQSMICDEAKFFNPKQIEGEVLPTLRGFDKIFGHKPEYLAKMYATDKYADYIRVKWLLDKRKKVDQKKVQTVYQLQLHQNELEGALETATEAEKKKILAMVSQIQTRLNLLRKDLTYVSEASAEDNRQNLGEAWWDEQKKKGEYEFDVATRNIDPTISADGFYPSLTPKLQYHELYPGSDYNAELPFIAAMDYQHSIAPMCLCQLSRLPWEKIKTVNFINEFHTMSPGGLEDTIDKFANYYAGHRNKLIFYVYDNTAIGKRASAKVVKDIVVDRLREKGWSVVEIYTAQGLDHFERYEKVRKRMIENPDSPIDWFPYRFNKTRMIKTLISMQGAGTVVVNGVTKKDKKYENTTKYPHLDQSETTHFSEVFDQIDVAVNELKMITDDASMDRSGLAFR